MYLEEHDTVVFTYALCEVILHIYTKRIFLLLANARDAVSAA